MFVILMLAFMRLYSMSQNEEQLNAREVGGLRNWLERTFQRFGRICKPNDVLKFNAQQSMPAASDQPVHGLPPVVVDRVVRRQNEWRKIF